MDLQKEIQFLKPLLKHQRTVARHLGINRETVAKYWKKRAVDFVLPEVSLAVRWQEKIDWEYVQSEGKKGVSIKTLYQEFAHIESLPTYQNFVRHFRLHKNPEKLLEISLKIDRIPGQTLEVDYSGDRMEILNPATGEILTAELFVAALSFSSYFYAEFTFTQKLPEFLNSCKNALEHIGRVPQFMVSDNCLVAVTKAEEHDVYLNKSFSDFCHHYNVIADPARVMRPKDKPHVENSIGVIQKEFFQEYRHRTFTSLLELNLLLKKYLLDKMNQKMPGRGLSRSELLALELPKMGDLPTTAFELFSYKKCKVHPDCHVRFERNFYSVPYRFVGKEVEIKCSAKMIYVYFEAEEIAVHLVAPGHNYYTTHDGHYPENKLIDSNYHIQSSLTKSKKIGPNTEALVMRLFAIPRNHPLRNLAKVQGILGLAVKYKTEAIEYGAEAALESNKLNYNYVKSCAKNYRSFKEIKTLLPNRQLEFACLQGGLE
jgi:transposase